MRILHIVPASPFGGAQRLTIDLAAAQRKAGHNAAVAFTNAGAAAMAVTDATGSPPLVFHNAKTHRLARIASIRRAAAAFAPDVVHLHIPPVWVLAALPSVPRRAAVVAHLHVLPPERAHQRTLASLIQRKLTNSLLARCDRLIAITNWVRTAYARAFPHLSTPVDLVYNGVHIPMQNPERRAVATFQVFGMASRLAPDKGVDEFLDLAAAIVKSSPNALFYIAGDGEPRYRKHLQDRIETLGLTANVRLVGFIEDIRAFWANIDLGAFTPPEEPFGLRLIEPIACGVPMLAYRTGSGADEIIDRCRGIAAVPYADVEGLADIAAVLASDPVRRAQMAAAGRSDIEAYFSFQAMSGAIEEVYAKALGSKRAAQGPSTLSAAK